MTARPPRPVLDMRGDVAVIGAYKAATLAVELVSLAVLLRLCGPAAFGVVAMVEGLLAIVSAAGDAGAGSALISGDSRSRGRVTAAGLVALGIGTALAVTCAIATPIVARLFQGQAVEGPWVALSLLLILAFLPAVPQAVMQVERRFSTLGRLQLASAAAAAALAIGVALILPGVWPFILRRVMLTMGSTALLLHAARMQWGKPSRDDWNHVVGFGRGLIGFNSLNALARNADNLLVGRVLGDAALGLYAFAYRMLTLPLSQISNVVGLVALPRLSALMPDGSKVGAAIGDLIGGTARLVSPSLVVLAALAPDIIDLALGPQWSGATRVFQIFSLLAIYQAPFALAGLVFLATGHTDRMFRWAAYTTPAVLLAFLIGVRWGIDGVATAYAIVSLGLSPFLLVSMARACAVSPFVIAAPALNGYVSGLVTAVPALAWVFCCRFWACDPVVLVAGSLFLALIGTAFALQTWLRSDR